MFSSSDILSHPQNNTADQYDKGAQSKQWNKQYVKVSHERFKQPGGMQFKCKIP